MPLVNFTDIAAVGAVPDLSPIETPINAWTNVNNMRFVDGCVVTIDSFTEYLSELGLYIQRVDVFEVSPSHVYIYVTGYITPGVYSTYCWTMPNNTVNAVTAPAGYSPGFAYSSTQHGELIIFNAYQETPYTWAPLYATAAAPNTLSPLPLTGLPSESAFLFLRHFGNYLVGYAYSKGGAGATVKNSRVWWTSATEAGTLPTTWDPSDAAHDAGYFDLEATRIFDAKTIRNVNYIYTDAGVFSMTWVGGQDVFAFKKVFDFISVFLSAYPYNNIITVDNTHIAYTGFDVVQHDGNSYKSLLAQKWQKWLASFLTRPERYVAALIKNSAENEVVLSLFDGTPLTLPWQEDFTYKLLRINYKTGTVSFSHRILGGTGGVDFPVFTAAGVRTSSRLAFFGYPEKVVAVSGNTTPTNIFERQKLSILEKRGISLYDKDGVPDIQSIKMLRSVYLRTRGNAGTLSVKVGTHDTPNGTITWAAPITYIIGSAQKLDVWLSGRFFALKIAGEVQTQWALTGLQIDIEKVGDSW